MLCAMDFDTEKFITEIQKRPAIWKYSDKIQRYRDWEDLAEAYGAKTDAETKQLALRLQKKWKNIRDMFVKTHKGKKGKIGPGKRRVEYAYYDNLLFLLGSECLNSNMAEDTPTISEDAMSAYEVKIEPAEDPLSSNDSWKRKKYETEEASIETASNKTGGDDVQLFFMSLVKEFNKIPEHLQIQAKIDLLKVIRDAQSVKY